MLKGIYRSASGMMPQLKKQEVIANNIANIGTSGFKRDRLFTKELTSVELKKSTTPTRRQTDWQVPLVDKTAVDFLQGTFDKTDNPLDLAIEGDGFFRLEGPDGTPALTRSGTFQIDSSGFLTYAGGYRVIGDGGPIQVGNGTLNVSQTGEVEVNGVATTRLVPVTVPDATKLQRLGGALFGVPQGVETAPLTQPTIRQGYLETANIDMVNEMVDMMVAYRAYEANAKALQVQDSSLDHLFTRVAGK